MITTTYNYASGSGFVYDNTKITFIGGMAELLLGNLPGQTFTPSISASSYGAALAYVESSLEQVDQRPVSATYYAAWTSSINANWSGIPAGSLTVTPEGAAVIDSDGLNLTGYNSATYAVINTTNNIDTTGTGTIEFEITPNYTGTPSNLQQFLSVSAGLGSVDNLINIFQNGGNLDLQVHNSGGGIAINTGAAWSPVAGTTYTFTLQYTSGATTLFIDGVSFLTSAATYARTAVGYCAVGSSYLGAGGQPNFWIKNFAWYSTVITPISEVLSPTIYLSATAILPLFTYAETGSLQAFTGLATSDINGVTYTVNGMYWNGSAWVSSNGSYSQANSSSIVNLNIASLTPASTLQINAIYPAGALQASLSALTMTYTGQLYPISGPTIATNVPLTMDSHSAFTDVTTHPGASHNYWYLNINGAKYWWTGSAWAISNGTSSQANPASDIQANASTLPISLGATVTPVAILYSPDGLETPTLTSLTLTYDFFGPAPSGPNVCTVFGYIYDENDNPIAGAVVSVTNPSSYINQGIIVAQGVRTATTDSLGYFSISLIETATLSGTNPVTFAVTYTQAQVGIGFSPVTYSFGAADIPNTPEANITSLTFL